jgi:hypothetical protein
MLYRDGIVYLSDADASDFSGKLTSLFFPEEFSRCIGIVEAADGLYVDNQKPERFDLSYRTLIGSGTHGDMFGYQIHLVYKCMATVSPRSRKTIGGDTSMTEFNFDIVCTPVKLPGFRPTAHYIIDTRGMSQSVIDELEDILYGTDVVPGRMPTPTELFDIMSFGTAITITVHTDGTFTVVASHDNLEGLSDTTFVIRNVNGTDHGDGTYTISDGGNTNVIIET